MSKKLSVILIVLIISFAAAFSEKKSPTSPSVNPAPTSPPADTATASEINT